MKVILNNGTELDAIVVNGSSRHFQGANRDSLEFQFASNSVTFEQLDTLFAQENNTNRIALQNGEISYLHENYSLRVSMGFAPVVSAIATDTAPEIIENRFTVVMAQKTYKEIQSDALRDTVDVLVMESLGV